jgi:hypothetical protein
MRSKLVLGAAMGMAGVLVALLGPAASQEARREIEVFSTDLGFVKQIDLGRKGFSSGDLILGRDPLLDPERGEKVGREVFRAQNVRVFPKARDGLVIVDATVILPEGRLVWHGTARFSQFNEGIDFAVTGGTGEFRDATGSVTVKNGRVGDVRGRLLTFSVKVP